MAQAAQSTVTLKHLAAAIAEQHEIAKKQSEEILNDAIGLVTKHLKKGDRIRIAGLGILQVRKRAARSGTQSRDRGADQDQGEQEGCVPRLKGPQGGSLIRWRVTLGPSGAMSSGGGRRFFRGRLASSLAGPFVAPNPARPQRPRSAQTSLKSPFFTGNSLAAPCSGISSSTPRFRRCGAAWLCQNQAGRADRVSRSPRWAA